MDFKVYTHRIINRLNLFFNSYTGIIISIFIFIILVFLRKTDTFLHAQFFAEDGGIWYQQAYNSKHLIHTFFTIVPTVGVSELDCRIVATLATLVPLKHAPLFFNSIGLIIQILPAVFFLSPRFKHIVNNHWHRFLFALLYILLPNIHEVHVQILNARWHLALIAFLCIVATPAAYKKTISIYIESMVVFISSLSGPFVIFLFPIFLIYRYLSKYKKEKQHILYSMGIGFIIQCIIILVIHSNRHGAHLGANIIGLFKILSMNIILPTIFSARTGVGVITKINNIIPTLVFIVAAIIMLYAFIYAPLEHRLFILFATLSVMAALISPFTLHITETPWQALSKLDSGNRYYFFASIAWAFSIVFVMYTCKISIIKYMAMLLFVCLIGIGIIRDFVYKPFQNFNYGQQVKVFQENVTIGDSFYIQIAPSTDWKIVLQKK